MPRPDYHDGYAQCERCLFRFKVQALVLIPGTGYHCQACCSHLSECDDIAPPRRGDVPAPSASSGQALEGRSASPAEGAGSEGGEGGKESR